MLKILTFILLGQGLMPIPGLTLREQASFSLSDATVRKALHLSPREAASVDAAFKANDEAREALAGKASSDAELVAMDKRFAEEAVKGLTPSEQKALFLRTVRQRGVAAVADPEVAQMIGLKGSDLARATIAAANMDRRDGDISEELAKKSMALPEAKTQTEIAANAAKRLAMSKAAAPRIKAREAARKHEEATLLASLPPTVRQAWAKLIQ